MVKMVKRLQSPHTTTVAAFVIAGVFLGIAVWLIQRNLRHNEPGLRAPYALAFALIISAAGCLVRGACRPRMDSSPVALSARWPRSSSTTPIIAAGYEDMDLPKKR